MKKRAFVALLTGVFLLSIIPTYAAKTATIAENNGHHGYLQSQTAPAGILTAYSQVKKNDKTGKPIFSSAGFAAMKIFAADMPFISYKNKEGFRLFWILLPVNVRK
jgi:hypothetical protein